MTTLDLAVSAILALREADQHTFGQITGRDARRLAEAVLGAMPANGTPAGYVTIPQSEYSQLIADSDALASAESAAEDSRFQ